MPSKEYRQRKIVELVEKRFISTQAEIARFLAGEEGIQVTQATVSRDVNELRLVRLPARNRLHHYPGPPLAGQEDVLGELAQPLRSEERRGGNEWRLRRGTAHWNAGM